MNKYSVMVRAGKNDIRNFTVEADDFIGHVGVASYIRFYNKKEDGTVEFKKEFNSKYIIYLEKEEK